MGLDWLDWEDAELRRLWGREVLKDGGAGRGVLEDWAPVAAAASIPNWMICALEKSSRKIVKISFCFKQGKSVVSLLTINKCWLPNAASHQVPHRCK